MKSNNTPEKIQIYPGDSPLLDYYCALPWYKKLLMRYKLWKIWRTTGFTMENLGGYKKVVSGWDKHE